MKLQDEESGDGFGQRSDVTWCLSRHWRASLSVRQPQAASDQRFTVAVDGDRYSAAIHGRQILEKLVHCLLNRCFIIEVRVAPTQEEC